METQGYSFEDLEVYKAAREYRKNIYQLLKKLPIEERFNLQGQMRRAALSVTNNIAEGHERYHYQENIQFLRQSRGSVEELIDDINVCYDEDYVEVNQIDKLKRESYDLLKKINGYAFYLRKRKANEN